MANLTNSNKIIGDLKNINIRLGNLELNMPTKLSQLENDTSFVTNTVNNLTNYYNRQNSYSKSEINDLLTGLVGLAFEVVTELPDTGKNGVIYLMLNEGEEENVYDEYVWIDDQEIFEKLGTVKCNLDDYYTKGEIDEKEKSYVKFGDNQIDSMDIYMSDANGNYIEFYPDSFYVENENGDAENYDFFGDYRLARLNETMLLFPLPERGDDITHIANIIKRGETVYFYQKDGVKHNIWVVAGMDGAYIISYMNIKGQYLNVLINGDDSEVISDGWFIEDAKLVYQDSYTWHFLPDNNTWIGEYFSVHKTTKSSFTVNTSGTFSMGFEYKLKVNNSGSNTITVTLGNNLLNPRNIPTTVEAGKEVIFLFYSSTNTVRNLELAQRIEEPSSNDMSNYYTKSEIDDMIGDIEALLANI